MGEKGFVKDEKKKISKDQILKDLKGAVGKLKKTNKVKLTKQDMKRESKHKYCILPIWYIKVPN